MPTADLYPAYILLVIGTINLLIVSLPCLDVWHSLADADIVAHQSFILILLERNDQKKGHAYAYTRYNRFHGMQRITFWKPLPDDLLLTEPTQSIPRRPGSMIRKDSETMLNDQLSMAESNKQRAGQMSYPTFSNGGINGRGSQIPRVGENGRMAQSATRGTSAAYIRDEEEEDEDEEQEEYLTSSAPPSRRNSLKPARSISNTTRVPVPPLRPISAMITEPGISPLIQNPAAKGVPSRLQQLMQAPSPFDDDNASAEPLPTRKRL